MSKHQRRKKKSKRKKVVLTSPHAVRAQLEGIRAAQKRYRKRQARGIIIDSIRKSEQRWENELKIRKIEDLDAFE